MKQLLLFGFLLLCMGCSTSRITSSWTKPNTTVASYNKIMVLALTGDRDRTLREAMERNTVVQLRELGYNAVSAFAEYGPENFEADSEKEAIDRLNTSGVDAVLTVMLLDKNKERYYVPGRVMYSPYAIYYNRFWGYYTTLYDRIYTPGYYSTDTRFFWETNLYNMNNRELVYSVQTESFDPGSASELGEDYAKLIIKDMVRNSVLAAK